MENYSIGETLLYVNNLNVGYKDKSGNTKLVLKNLSFVEKNISRNGIEATGQTIAFLGRSGRGKSTLFKVLTGLIKPTSGDVLISDLSTEDKDDAKTITEGLVGFVDQKYTLFRHKTVQQICQYALRKSNLTKVDKKSMLDSYLQEWGLSEHKDKYPIELSGGQRQRTSILENILSNKHFLVLDEPAASLDCGNVDKLKQYFTKFSSENEFNTIIFSTHDINLAVELADSIYVIGFPEGETSTSTIIKHYDLKEMGLAWTPFDTRHIELVKDIKDILLKS